MNVIFIDDDEDLNFLQSRMCMRSSVINNYYIANSAVQALDYLAETDITPDVIFVDINMPEINGFQFIEKFEDEFSSRFPETQLYVLTSSVSEKDRKNSLEFSSVKDFLIKPLTQEKLENICLQQVNS
ncbi:MAG TPA: response regulator [Cyclobacteriaceae bacterium]|nr:response regulator [Cyclobacteriaceae bacterium]